MHPRLLQNEIHQNFSVESGIWSSYKAQINSLASESHQDINDHLIREFNRKISDLNQPTGLFFTPYDAGFRFLGSI